MPSSPISAVSEDTISSNDYILTQRGVSNFRVNLMQAVSESMGTRGSIYNILDYGAVGDGATDNKAAIQAAHDAAETAGGGIVFVPEGIFLVTPVSGIALLFNGDKVKLIGTGKNSVLRFDTLNSGILAFEGIASKGYNTTSTSYGASGLWVESLTVEADDGAATANVNAPSRNAHGLIGIVHAPWAVIKDVTFGSVVYHQIEINKSRNVVIEDCNFIGNTESSRVQFDIGGSAGQRSGTPTTTVIENVWFENCRFGSRDITSQNLGGVRMIELDHTGNTNWNNVTFNRCEFGTSYNTSSAAICYTLAFDATSLNSAQNLTVSNCKFYGDCHGVTAAIYLVPGSGIIRGIKIENNYFGPGYDVLGVRHAGGFFRGVSIGTHISPNTISGSSTSSTNYANRSNIVIRNNIMMPKFVNGLSSGAVANVMACFLIAACSDATVESNYVKFPVVGGEFTAAVTDILTTTGSSTTDGMMVGDPLRFTTTTTLPGGLLTGTTYYVREILSSTTFKVSDTDGGAAVNITDIGSGTHTWANYAPNVTNTYFSAFGIAEVPNVTFRNNSVLLQHNATIASNLPYNCVFNVKDLEANAISGWWEVVNNRMVEVGVGVGGIGMYEFATSGAEVASPYIQGRWAGNTHTGTFANQNVLEGHKAWFDEGDTQVRTTDTASFTSTILAAQMSTRVTQSGRYKIFGKIIYTTAASTDGIKLAINGPTTTTLALHWSAQTSDTGEVTELYTTTDGDTFTTTTRPATGSAWVATVSGYATFSAPGVISLEAASEVGSSTIIKAGSMLEISAV